MSMCDVATTRGVRCRVRRCAATGSARARREINLARPHGSHPGLCV